MKEVQPPLLQVLNLMTPATDIHDPLPAHPRIKSGSNLDSKLQLKGSPCNFPLKLERSQQLVIHMHLKSNTLLQCPSVAPPFLTHQWTSTPSAHSGHYTIVLPPSFPRALSLSLSLSLSFLALPLFSPFICMLPRLHCQGTPSQLDSTQGLIW